MRNILNEITPRLIEITPGLISLRDDRTLREWEVDLKPYSIGKYPVTQSLYFQITGTLPSTTTCDDCPVSDISWLDAVKFCNLISRLAGLDEHYVIVDGGMDAAELPNTDGYRLPSEAEWEYACRAGSKATRYGPLDDIAWYADNSDGKSHPVGQRQPNAWGLFDMIGNVWEWCSDLYDPSVYGSYRIFRGGGWADHDRGCLVTNRRRSHPTFKIDDLGFRLARSKRLPDGRSEQSRSGQSRS